MFTNQVLYKKQRILRIIVSFTNGSTGTGSGFFINNKGRLLTCFHVLFGGELKNLRNDNDFKLIAGQDENSRLQTWFSSKVSRIQVELSDGSKEDLILVGFDERYDIAFADLENKNILKKIKFCKLSFKSLDQGDQVFFGGFPICYPYKNEESPFAINTGIVSSFPETIVGGEKYRHLQINTINLGGNSGAPLFLKNRNKVIGIINGNMNWGADNFAFVDPNGNIVKGPFRPPLSIAYATPLKLLKDESVVFKHMTETVQE